MRQRVIMGAAVGTMQPPVCHFWKLPLELRFAIYDLAYGRGKTITPKESATLVQLGRGRVQEQYSDVNDRKKRRTVVGRRLVNKQYLAETMQHLAETNTFCVRWVYGGFALVSSDFARHIRSLAICWNVHTYDGKMDLHSVCPRLRSLHILVNAGSLFHENWSEIAEKRNFNGTLIVKAFSLVRGMESFSLIYDDLHTKRYAYPWPSWHVMGDAKAKADRLQVRLQETLRRMVTRPRDPISDGSIELESNDSNARSRFPRAAKKSVKY